MIFTLTRKALSGCSLNTRGYQLNTIYYVNKYMPKWRDIKLLELLAKFFST